MEKINRWLLLVILITSAGSAYSQENRYIVYFADKEGTPYTLENPEAYLSERSIQRRQRQSIAVNEQDLPVNPAYLDQVREITGQVYYPSKWLNAVVIQNTESIANEVRSLPFVTGVELGALDPRYTSGGRAREKFEFQSATNVANDFHLQLHGINKLHSAGYKGQGMMVAIMDSGFPGVDTIAAFDHVYAGERVLMHENMVTNSTVPSTHFHGTYVWSIMAAVLPDQYQGIAPEATYLLFTTEDVDSEYRIEEYNWVVAVEKADSAGVDVLNTSLGYTVFDLGDMDYAYEQLDGQTAMISRGANWAFDRGILVVTSAGNSGRLENNHVGAPADAPGSLSVGAANSSLQPASFSSFGPTSDGRIKPEVSSLGVSTPLIRTNGTLGSSSGTSFSSPIIAGFATLLWQRNRDMTVSELKEYIISISDLPGAGTDPQLGYGFPFLAEQITSTEEDWDAVGLFPNPVKSGERITIQSEVSLKGIRLFSMEGREIMIDPIFTGNTIQFQADLPAGIYLVRVFSDRESWSFRLVSH